MATLSERASAFVEANAGSPVIYGRAIEPDPRKPAKGAIYRLKNGKEFYLSVNECREVGMPRWDL